MEPDTTVETDSTNSSSSSSSSSTSSASSSSTSSEGGNFWQRPSLQAVPAPSVDSSGALWGLSGKQPASGKEDNGGMAAAEGVEGGKDPMGSPDGKKCSELLYIQMEFCPRTLKVMLPTFTTHAAPLKIYTNISVTRQRNMNLECACRMCWTMGCCLMRGGWWMKRGLGR